MGYSPLYNGPGIKTNNLEKISQGIFQGLQLSQKNNAATLKAMQSQDKARRELYERASKVKDSQLPWWGIPIVDSVFKETASMISTYNGDYASLEDQMRKLETVAGEISMYDSEGAGAEAYQKYTTLIPTDDDANNDAISKYNEDLSVGTALDNSIEGLNIRKNFYDGGGLGIPPENIENHERYNWEDFFTINEDNTLTVLSMRNLKGEYVDKEGNVLESPTPQYLRNATGVIHPESIYTNDIKNSSYESLGGVVTSLGLIKDVKELHRSNKITNHLGKKDPEGRRIAKDILTSPYERGITIRFNSIPMLETMFPEVFNEDNQRVLKAWRNLKTDSSVWKEYDMDKYLNNDALIGEISKLTQYPDVKETAHKGRGKIIRELQDMGYRQYDVPGNYIVYHPVFGQFLPIEAREFNVATTIKKNFELSIDNPKWDREEAERMGKWYKEPKVFQIPVKYLKVYTDEDGKQMIGIENPQGLNEILLDPNSDWDNRAIGDIETAFFEEWKGELTLKDLLDDSLWDKFGDWDAQGHGGGNNNK